MLTTSVKVRTAGVPAGAYDITIGEHIFDQLGEIARKALAPRARKIALISNARVFALYGAAATEALRRAEFDVMPWLMGEGERYKSMRTIERALDFFCEMRLERSDAVIALGGGVVGDAAGFAAAVYLRGVPLIQVPTTLLAQIDSSVGGKTGVNSRWGKNLIGSFHPPRAVLIDIATHRTLPRRELTAGWCEAIKQGAVGSAKLFRQTTSFLTSEDRRNHLSAEKLSALIAAQCAFKAAIVAGDEREDLGRTDARSRKILNFGHTIGHALENVTNYRRFRHGEAVGYGVLAAGELSLGLGLLATSELESLRHAVRAAGRLPRADDLDQGEIITALGRDKKSIAGNINWVLLESLGRARIVDGSLISPKLLRATLRSVLRAIS